VVVQAASKMTTTLLMQSTRKLKSNLFASSGRRPCWPNVIIMKC
jgi:hypothetical protein